MSRYSVRLELDEDGRVYARLNEPVEASGATVAGTLYILAVQLETLATQVREDADAHR